MTADETAKWKAITSDAEAQSFIDLFWARRDPTPATPANEVRDDFEARVAATDKAFTYKGTPGSMTDRGRTVVVLGKFEKRMAQKGGAAAGTGGSDDSDAAAGFGNQVNRTPSMEVWQYDASKVPGMGTGTVEIHFVDRANVGDYHFDMGRRTADLEATFAHVNEARITNPNPEMAAQTTTQTTTTKTVQKTTTTTEPAGPAPLATPALLAAVAAEKGGTSTLPKVGTVVETQLVSPTGEFYVPIGIYVPKSAGLGADAADTLFVSIDDAAGSVYSSFEQPVKPFVSGGDLLADWSVALPTGKYSAVVGLAKGGQPVVVASKKFDVTDVAKDATGTSAMILSNNLAETLEAAPMKSPFAFGKLKVVPKGNLAFSSKDDLSYFIEVHNPGIDAATNLPKLQSKIELSGGKLKAPISAPLSDAPALPLSGAPGPGQYAIANSIPLGQMTNPLPPGDYVLRVKLIDTVSKKTYDLEQPFKIQ
jgi:GWxTD domain-containing protein